MKRILVTGLIGSGKSELCRYFTSLGFPVYDCDSRMKALYREEPGLLEKCEKAVGAEYENFASIIFKDAFRLQALESAAFPSLVEDMSRWEREQDSPLVFIESATATSKPQFDGLYDEVLLVRSDAVHRSLRNPGSALRQEFQCEPEDFAYVIENNSDIASLRMAADKFIKEIQ